MARGCDGGGAMAGHPWSHGRSPVPTPASLCTAGLVRLRVLGLRPALSPAGSRGVFPQVWFYPTVDIYQTRFLQEQTDQRAKFMRVLLIKREDVKSVRLRLWASLGAVLRGVRREVWDGVGLAGECSLTRTKWKPPRESEFTAGVDPLEGRRAPRVCLGRDLGPPGRGSQQGTGCVCGPGQWDRTGRGRLSLARQSHSQGRTETNGRCVRASRRGGPSRPHALAAFVSGHADPEAPRMREGRRPSGVTSEQSFQKHQSGRKSPAEPWCHKPFSKRLSPFTPA